MNTEILDIDPATAAAVRENARRLGVSVTDYLNMLLPPETEMALGGDSSEEAFERDMAELCEELGDPTSYSGTYDRSDIYFDHD